MTEMIPCPCTTYEQDESCPVGYPSLLCWACGGIGRTTIDKVVALAAEMMRIADEAGETSDPFAAWESLRILDAHTAEQPHTGEIENAVSGDLPSVLGGSDSLARDGALIEQAKALLAINASGNAVPRVPNLAVEIIQRFIDTAAQPAPDAVAEAHVCRCGGAMSKNPHPDAGKPFTLLETGAVWVCIPCQSGTLHRWAERANAAENKIAAAQEALAKGHQP